ncbi:hypothetical protein [Streptacidiphilus fuscans]|uniref:Uncharacterized protein n=1 Tax=Streptacidiphilus fuscans TaxID=2789292 RepID=A0A931BDP8_9ACTN|nr:hypothetical protein [Streptacidiphilus fuscans]MBF9073726.1 hypothetical protein [Streptacidiphilus fuscans]
MDEETSTSAEMSTPAQTSRGGDGRLRPVVSETAARRRRRALRLLVLCVVVLVPWTVYLAFSLPDQFEARHWSAAWVGFDVLLLLSLAAAGLAVWQRRQALIPLSIVAGTLLVCDAWFDITLDWGTRDVWSSVAAAVLVELPLALLLFLRARRLYRITVRLAWERMGLPGEPPPLHRLPLFSGLDSLPPDGVSATSADQASEQASDQATEKGRSPR